MNWIGLYYLSRREVMRFLTTINQMLLPPIISAGLYLLIFHFVIGERMMQGVPYIEFLLPGLIMMTVISAAFSNSSGSLFFSKWLKHFEYYLSLPFSYLELTLAYVIGAIGRGVVTGLGITIVALLFVHTGIHNVFVLLLYFLLSCVVFGSLGIIAALWASDWEGLGIFTTFIISPLTMLGGVFYSIETLPPVFQMVTLFNPIFYFVDGFRYGMLGVHDHSLLFGFGVCFVFALLSFFLAMLLMKKGWKVRC
ncbi:TPA: ABC transporter permease [Candidatus Woesearchaeota archaeon]|nr:ABC transporter permease [Candidatus Woesearchaeota archaeon]